MTNDSWTEISTTNAPSARTGFAYLLQGSYLYIWGGKDANGNYLNTGAYYNISNNTWTTLEVAGTNIPSGRTGSVPGYHYSRGFFVFGGENASGKLNDSYFYSDLTKQWFNFGVGTPPSARADARGVVYGDYFFVWGGRGSGDVPLWGGIGTSSTYLNTGLIYDISGNSWTTMSSSGISGRYGHSAVLSDSNNMIIWGGTDGSSYYGDGKKYNIPSDSWSSISTGPEGRAFHSKRAMVSGVWSGSSFIVWGGENPNWQTENTGGIYTPGVGWAKTSETGGVPGPRAYHFAKYTDSGMAIWGGDNYTEPLGDGAILSSSNEWSPLPSENALSKRHSLSGDWNGRDLFMWGGKNYGSTLDDIFNDGVRFYSSNFSPTNLTNAPRKRTNINIVWMDKYFFVWGGSTYNSYATNSGALYCSCLLPPPQSSNPNPSNGSSVCPDPDLSWDPASGARTYDVYYDTAKICSDITSTTCDPGTISTGSHTWYVIAKNGCPVHNNQSATWIFYVDNQSPGEATNIFPPHGSYVCPNPTLDWDPAQYARRYDVYLDSIKSGSTSTPSSGAFTFSILSIPSSPTVQDKDICALSGVEITWNAVDGATGYDLIVDGTTIIQNVTSPYTYMPGDSNSHSYQIRAKNSLCTTSWSSSNSGADENNTPTPTISGPNENTCPNEFVVLSTQSGMSNYQWYRNSELISGANDYQFTATSSGTYAVYYKNSYGCGNTSSGHSVTINLCYGPEPVADGKLYGNGAKFKKASDFGTTGNIDVTFDNTTCSDHHISILYGNLIGPNNFDGYDGCALDNGGNSGLTTFGSSSQNNVWYNIVWVSSAGRAGHPGYFYQNGSNGQRNWAALGICSSITSELQNDPSCNGVPGP